MNQESIKDADCIAFVVTGGIGRNIEATATIRSLKKTYPDKELHVIAGCPDIMLLNPNIKKVHRLGQHQYFFEDYILNKKTVYLEVEPYRHYDYIYKRKHFVECWCDELNIPCDGIYPEIFLNKNEQRMAEMFLEKFKDPIILIQASGGKNPNGNTEKDRLISASEMYQRNIPEKIIQYVADYFIKQGYMIGSVQSENQYVIKGAEKIMFPIRAITALIPHVSGLICIDSFLQHASACFKKKSLVLWGGTSPKVLGYDCHVNLVNDKSTCNNLHCHRPNSYLFDMEINNFPWQCPLNASCMDFDPDYIIEEFKKILKETGNGESENKIIEEVKENKCNGCN